MQDAADRLARDRIVQELSKTEPRIGWEPLEQLLRDALDKGDVGRLRIAFVAVTVWQGRWWEWWQEPAGMLLLAVKGIQPYGERFMRLSDGRSGAIDE